jgi:hypothetical protein
LGRGVNRITIYGCYALSRLLLMNFCIPVSSHAILAPAGTPPNVVARFIVEAKRALQVPEVEDKLATLAIEAGGTTAEELTVTLNDEMKQIRLRVKPGVPRPE